MNVRHCKRPVLATDAAPTLKERISARVTEAGKEAGVKEVSI